jgi:tRNA threonylcarbamoyladenosine biosynthesis protein TsaB
VDGEPVAELSAKLRARHGETLLPQLERVLSASGLDIGDVDLLAVGLGPGSFTGLRIGLSTAKGLSLARGTPIVGVRTTRAIARGAFGAVRVPVVDGHKGEVFVAVYRADDTGRLHCEHDEAHGSPAAMGARLRSWLGDVAPTLVGTGLTTHGDALGQAFGAPVVRAPRAYETPRGALLALEAEEAFAARGPDDVATLEPLYVRASDAALPSASARPATSERTPR